jgi:signal transduction histidine kinase
LKFTLRDHWRISTFRLAALFGILFTIGNVALLGLIYWQTSTYLVHRIDHSIHRMMRGFDSVEPAHVLTQVNDALTYDLRKSNIYALFEADGKWMSGNMKRLPSELVLDGEIHQFAQHVLPQYSPTIAGAEDDKGLARAVATRLSNGQILVVGRDFTQLDEIKAIILNALVVSGGVIITLGLIGGFALSVRPLRRVNAMRDASRRIAQGELSLRMPVSGRHDEVDMLAAMINLMLGEIERLLTEVKSVTDTLAHDLRTPLTRVRLMLYRMQQQTPESDTQQPMLQTALSEIDILLRRFRALLRISEIENRQRKAGFELVNPRDVLRQIAELFEPLAEDKSLQFDVICQASPILLADPDLLFEALSNLVDNAIKFTPVGGKVMVRLGIHEAVAVIDIIDTGCGIDANEREAVIRRFYRSNHHHDQEGFGLGLGIVAAIIHLHGFELKFHDAPIGTHLSVICTATPRFLIQLRGNKRFKLPMSELPHNNFP